MGRLSPSEYTAVDAKFFTLIYKSPTCAAACALDNSPVSNFDSRARAASAPRSVGGLHVHDPRKIAPSARGQGAVWYLFNPVSEFSADRSSPPPVSASAHCSLLRVEEHGFRLIVLLASNTEVSIVLV